MDSFTRQLLRSTAPSPSRTAVAGFARAVPPTHSAPKGARPVPVNYRRAQHKASTAPPQDGDDEREDAGDHTDVIFRRQYRRRRQFRGTPPTRDVRLSMFSGERYAAEATDLRRQARGIFCFRDSSSTGLFTEKILLKSRVLWMSLGL